MSSGGQGNSRGTGALQRVAHACAPLAISEGRSLPVGMLVPGIAKGAGRCSRVKRGNNTPPQLNRNCQLWWLCTPVHDLVSCMKGWTGPLHTVAKSLRAPARAAAVVGCLLGGTGLVEQEGKWEMEFYDCILVFYVSGLCCVGFLGSVSNIYTINSLYTFSEVCTDLLSSA